MQKVFFLFILAGILFSCQQPSSETVVEKAPVDSLIENFSQGWNNHDSTSVINLFKQDALLTDDNLVAENASEIADKWIHPNINLVNHFKTTKLQDWSSQDRAGYTGTYEFDVILNDSLLANIKGLYTLNWIKEDTGEWKITTAAIHSLEQ